MKENRQKRQTSQIVLVRYVELMAEARFRAVNRSKCHNQAEVYPKR